MCRRRLVLRNLALMVAVGLAVPLGSASGADAPAVRQLRTQRVADVTYFHVRFAVPTNLSLSAYWSKSGGFPSREDLVRLPQFVPQDGKTGTVYYRLNTPQPPGEYRAASEDALDFVGVLRSEGKAAFVLLYATVVGKARQFGWNEVELTLDFAEAKDVPLPEKNRQTDNPRNDELKSLWAIAQAARFAVLEALDPDNGFYRFGRMTTGRRYGIPARGLRSSSTGDPNAEGRRLYETTTGAAAMAESLQLKRLLDAKGRDDGKRTIDINRVPGVAVGEHPWKQMIGNKKPAPEPLAEMTPNDNYYLAFKDFRKFLAFGDLLDEWGTNVIRAYEITSRDYQLRQRYEKQLCMRTTAIGRRLGPALIRGIALTGSDPYLREGSDVAILFDTTSPILFLAAVDSFIEEARKEFGDTLKEEKETYRDIATESFVAPRREVSLHRAVVGDVVIYANSPVGLRRILDTHKGKHPALADSVDFQYMRTVFRHDDAEEDGFGFLSDAFIRQLVGPASKIKAKRRLEGLRNLSILTHGALFTAWENGKLPADHSGLLKAVDLQSRDVELIDDRTARWNHKLAMATSEVYNTQGFATPLIALNIDWITAAETSEYDAFREEYLRLWRRYFDPIGMRFSLSGPRVRVETYVLPLIQSGEYNQLRDFTGGGTTTYDPARVPSNTLMQYLVHLAPQFILWNLKEQGVGAWLVLQLDDSADLRPLAELGVRQALQPETGPQIDREIARLVLQLPWTVGVRVDDHKKFSATLESLAKELVESWGPCKEEVLKKYKDVEIKHLEFCPDSKLVKELIGEDQRKDQGFTLHIYHAYIDKAWYASLSEKKLQERIDADAARNENKDKKSEKVEINSALYLSPAAAVLARDGLRYYLEGQSHVRALGNCSAWYPLYRCGVVTDDMPEDKRRAAAMRYLGYVPVSPEGATYTFAARSDEVVNKRHGSARKPEPKAGIETDSPLGRLFDQMRWVRADLRFREDGVHTVLALNRKPDEPASKDEKKPR